MSEWMCVLIGPSCRELYELTVTVGCFELALACILRLIRNVNALDAHITGANHEDQAIFI